MADEGEFDPNAGVAPWINIVVPIISVASLFGVFVLVYFMPYEIDVKRLELWAQKLRLVKRPSMITSTPRRGVTTARRNPPYSLTNQNNNLVSSEISSIYSKQFYTSDYGSMGTLISFESNV